MTQGCRILERGPVIIEIKINKKETAQQWNWNNNKKGIFSKRKTKGWVNSLLAPFLKIIISAWNEESGTGLPLNIGPGVS